MTRKRIVKNDLTEHTKGENFIVSCNQKDNVYRDGYVSIEQQYKQFQRAGINRMEWLKKAYPQELTELHEKNATAMKEQIKATDIMNSGDSLNTMDGINIAKDIESRYKNELEKKENEIEAQKRAEEIEIEAQKRAEEILKNQKPNE